MAKGTVKRESWMCDFVPLELSQEQAAQCKIWVAWQSQQQDVILRAVESGYKLTMTWDEKYHCHVARMQATDKSHVNAGWIMAGRGSTPMKALKQVLYKHYVLCEGESWPIAGISHGTDIDD